MVDIGVFRNVYLFYWLFFVEILLFPNFKFFEWDKMFLWNYLISSSMMNCGGKLNRETTVFSSLECWSQSLLRVVLFEWIFVTALLQYECFQVYLFHATISFRRRLFSNCLKDFFNTRVD